MKFLIPKLLKKSVEFHEYKCITKSNDYSEKLEVLFEN